MLNSGHVTVTGSIGVTEVVGREVFDNDLHAADQYLYLAKQGGRNRIYCDHLHMCGCVLLQKISPIAVAGSRSRAI
ncbi:hypothetical protein RvVAT039_01910 [Agrobacterium vitis]|nr:hypothetical protein [Agrobacterium vitis]BCH62975.1 hypothetical protein RvVAT039_01910 [Agrobacterium vitis]